MKTALQASKDDMSAFLSDLTARKTSREATASYKRSRGYRSGIVREKIDECARNAAEKVFCSIYNNAIPLDSTHRAVYEADLNSALFKHVQESGANDVYDYLRSKASKGSIPAKTICENANKYANEMLSRYYVEEDEDPEELDTTKDSDNVTTIADRITADMSADQVSAAIEANVRAAIQKEMEISVEEDRKLAELEEQLSKDETVKEEADIEMALYRAGYPKNKIYQPSLFTGIMLGKVKEITEEGELEGDAIQKRAFYESVKELTALQTLHTLCCIDINPYNVDQYARRYASGLH